MPGNCGLIGHIAGTLVDQGWTRWSNFASEAIDETNEHLDALNSVSLTPVALDIDFETITSLSTPFAKPSAPVAPDLNYVEPNAPADASLGDVSVPVLAALNLTAPTEPALSLPIAPDVLGKLAPTDVPDITALDLPTAPVLNLPDSPTLRTVLIPDVPDLTLSKFEEEAPTADILEPDSSFVFVEELYESNLLDSLQGRISEMLAGGTGLPDPIWQAVWEKNTEREDKNGVKAVREVTEEWAARGFSLPPGVLTTKVQEVRQQVLEAKNTASREVAVQQAQMEVENVRFAVAQALALEDTLMSNHLQRQARALQKQQVMSELSINIFNAKVQLFNANVEGFRAKVEVYRTKLEGETKELEAYRIELEGKRIEGELNRQEMEIYMARLQALNTEVTLYRSQIEAVQAIAETDRIKLDTFKTRVQAFSEEVGAKTAEFQAYSEQVKGELAKTQVYDSQVRAYGSRIEAWKTHTDGQIAQTKLQYDAEALKLGKFGAQLDSYKAKVAAEVGRISAGATVFEAESKLYAAELGAESARVETEDKQFALAVEEARARTSLELKKAEVNIAQAQRIAELEQEQLKTIAGVQSSLAAGAMSAVNLSAGVNESASNGTSCSTTYSL